MKINVLNKDLGFWTQEPVTVQRFSDEGELLWCNHAGSYEETYEKIIYRPDSPDSVWYEKVLVCDRCVAYKPEHVGSWEDAPFEGVHNG